MAAAFGTASEVTLKEAALAEPGTEGLDLVATVTTPSRYTVGEGRLLQRNSGLFIKPVRL
jgi:hypothetical protein